jgi:hypothetical protein
LDPLSGIWEARQWCRRLLWRSEYAAGVDGVVADPVVTVVERCAGRDRFGPGIVGLLGGAPVQGAVGPDGVVVGAEGIELAVQLSQGPGSGLRGEPFLQGLSRLGRAARYPCCAGPFPLGLPPNRPCPFPSSRLSSDYCVSGVADCR